MEDEVVRRGASKTYCVTGATGYVGSWLVKTLLDRGFVVHATARDPGLKLSLPLCFIVFGLLFMAWSLERRQPNCLLQRGLRCLLNQVDMVWMPYEKKNKLHFN